MRTKFKCLTILYLLILSILIVHWDVDSYANNIDNDENNTSTSRYDKLPRSGNFDWGSIDVISEPIIGQDNNINLSSKPKIAFEDDKIYVVWHDTTDYNGAGGDYDIFYRYFDGSKWSEIQVISEPVEGQNINTGDSYGPDIAVENSKIYVVWSDSNNTNGAGTDGDIFYRCNLTSSSWENIQVISEPCQGVNFNIKDSSLPAIAVENGRIHIVWFDSNNTNGAGIDGEIFYRCNLTGLNWEYTQVISEPVKGKDFNVDFSTEPAIAVENDKIYVVWEDKNNTNNASGAGPNKDIFYRCNLSGTSWEDIQVISEPVFGRDFNTVDSYFPEIAIEIGNIYVVWCDNNNTFGSGDDSDILYRCNFTGYSWENIQVISEPAQGVNINIKDSTQPAIAVENGRIYIVWYDENNTNSAGSDGEIFFKSQFNDLSWEPVQVISEPVEGSNFNVDFSHGPDIVVNLGKSFIVWQDLNNTDNVGTDWDIFYRRIKDTSPLFLNQPNISPTLGNTSTNFNFSISYFHYNNKAPIEIIVNISGLDYPIVEVDQADINYTDGKNYYFNIKNLDIGIHKYQFYASDNTFTWLTPIVNNPTVYNTPPNITTEDNITAFEDVYYDVNYVYEDIDVINVCQPIFWNFSTNANWLEFNLTTGILNGTPTNEDVGEYWINITIYDTIDVDYTNFTLSVSGINDPPKIITEDIIISTEDEFYEVDYDAEDIDNIAGELNWDIITNASWLEFDPLTAIISGAPTNDDVGEHWINISVSDTEYIDYTNFTLTVINTNDPPVITSEDKTHVTVGKLYSAKYEAVDIDPTNDKLTWSLLSNSGNWLTIDLITGWLTGIPSVDDVGTYWVNISVTDDKSGWDFQNFTLRVLELPIQKNNPPILSNITITPSEGNIETSFTFSIHYYDADSDAHVSFQVIIDDIPRILKLKSNENVSNGIYYYNTTLTEGTHIYYFIASDGLDTVKSENFTTPEIKKLEEPSKERTFWYWLIWIIIFVIIIFILITTLYLYKKRKAAKILVVKAELMKAAPRHLVLPNEIPSGEITQSLSIQPKIFDQLPAPKAQAQPTMAIPGEKVPVPTLTPTPMATQFQLPQATLSKAQLLHLLRERFLRGEVTEETYNKLRSEIEGSANEDITMIEEDVDAQSIIIEHKQSELIEESIQQLPIEHGSLSQPSPAEITEALVPEPEQIPREVNQQQPTLEQSKSMTSQPEQIPRELPSTPELKGEDQEPQPKVDQQPQPSAQVLQQLKPIVKKQSDDE